MIDPPKLLNVLDCIVGSDALLSGVQPRTVPPENEGGYTSVGLFKLLHGYVVLLLSRYVLLTLHVRAADFKCTV